MLSLESNQSWFADHLHFSMFPKLEAKVKSGALRPRRLHLHLSSMPTLLWPTTTDVSIGFGISESFPAMQRGAYSRKRESQHRLRDATGDSMSLRRCASMLSHGFARLTVATLMQCP